VRFRSSTGLPLACLAGRVATPAPLLGLSHRSAHPFRRSPHTPVLPTAPVKVRVQGFSPSSRLAPLSASWVYFTPQTPFGFALQGVPLLRSCHSSSLQLCRHAVGPSVALPPLAGGSSGVRDLAPRKALSVPWADFAALLPERVRSVQWACLAPSTGRAPPGLCHLRGLPARCDATVRHRSSRRALVPASAPPSCPDGPAACRATRYHSPSCWRCLSRGCLPSLTFLATWFCRFSADRSWPIFLASGPRLRHRPL